MAEAGYARQDLIVHKESTDYAVSFMDTIDQRLADVRDELIAFRRDLHRNPEVSGQEKRTARVVAERLRALGLDVRTNVGGYGVVALLRGTRAKPLVAFRADMDAVFSDQPDPVEFASEVPGVRHICGHDIHTTVGIALAEGLTSIREQLEGSVLFVFQPAEENVRGARAMLEDGAFQNTPDAIFAYHTSPLQVGQIATKPDAMLAGRDRLTINLYGQQDLASIAQSVRDLIQELNTVRPNQASVEGDFFMARFLNSERQPAENALTIRTAITTTSDELREHAQNTIRQKLDSYTEEGISYDLDYQTIAAGVNNDPALEQSSHTAIQSVVGTEGLVHLTTVPTAFSEDFGAFQIETPGVMYFLGVSNSEKGWVGMPHSPQYVADEEAIFVGAQAMAAVMLDYFAARMD